MKKVKLIAAGVDPIELAPDHAQRVLNLEADRGLNLHSVDPEDPNYTVVDGKIKSKGSPGPGKGTEA